MRHVEVYPGLREARIEVAAAPHQRATYEPRDPPCLTEPRYLEASPKPVAKQTGTWSGPRDQPSLRYGRGDQGRRDCRAMRSLGDGKGRAQVVAGGIGSL